MLHRPSPSRLTFGQLSQTRANNFDFLRFFLAFVVIYTHAFALSGVHETSWRQRLAHGNLGGAWIAVDFFFVISGFLVTQSYLNSRGPLDYWKKRVLRIYPGFVAALAFCVFVVGPLAGVSLHEYFANPRTYAYFQPLVLRETTALPGVFTDLPMAGMVNGSLWTIRFELMCYGLVAVIGALGLLRNRLLVLCLFLLSIALAAGEATSFPNHAIWLRLGDVPYFGNVYELPRFVNCFLAGMTVFVFRDRIPYSTPILLLSLAALAGTAPWALSLAMPIFGAYVLFHFAFNRRIPLNHFGRFGDFSYGLYLYAFPIEQLLVLHWRGPIHPWPLLAVAFAATMVLAVLSWHLLEHPFLKLKSRAPKPSAPTNGSALGVLLLTDADVFAGTERHILALARALRSQEGKVLIGCPVPSPLADRAAQENIIVVPIAKRGLIDWRAAGALRRLVQNGTVPIVHAHNGRTALAAAIGLCGTPGRLVVTQHFLDPAHAGRRGPAAIFSRLIHRWINARADRFIAISRAVADSMRRRDPLNGDRIAVVHNGLAPCDPADLQPAAEIRDQLGLDASAPLIVCAARLEPEKDVASLITAMRQVRNQFPAARCLIAGEGSLRARLQSQIDRMSLQEHVRLLGFRADVLSLINAGDCFVLPSLAEPFGLVLLEAMALAKPTVATLLGGPVEIVQEGVTGLLVPPSDPAALAQAICRILADPPAAAEMGRRGKMRFGAYFTDRQMAAAMTRVYREMTPKPAGSQPT